MDFEKARFNMIEQQIRPWNVLNQAVLDLLTAVKREHFVAADQQSLAFTDCELPIKINGKDTGQTMLAPKIEGKFLQEVEIKPTDKVLEIGTGTGYMAALLAQKAAHVTTFEADPAIADLARTNLKKLGITRVKVVTGCGFAESKALGNFDVIVLSGSSEVMPENLVAQLNAGGRLIGVIGQQPVMQAVLLSKNTQGQVGSVPLFETIAKPLVNCPKAKAFVF